MTTEAPTTEKQSNTEMLFHAATPSGYFSHFETTAGKWAMAIFYPFWVFGAICSVICWWALFAVVLVLVAPFRLYAHLTKKGDTAPDGPKARD